MTDDLVEKVQIAIMEARINWGWTFGKRKRVMAIDMLIAQAIIPLIASAAAEIARSTFKTGDLHAAGCTIARKIEGGLGNG